jgi:hypothetical protein
MASGTGSSDKPVEQDKSNKESRTDRGGFTTSLGAVLGIATTTVVAVFAALGVSGNLLARMVRNDPSSASWILSLAIIAVLLAAIVTALPAVRNELIVVPIVGLGIVLIFAALEGAHSQGKRENPSISLSLTKSQAGNLTLTAKATGSSLRSDDRMLLRVAAIIRPLSTKELPGLSTADRTTELRNVTNQECKHPELHPLSSKNARMLSWTETGANASGEATTEQTVPVPSNAKYVCAWSILSALPTDPRENAPENFALIDLTDMRIHEKG